MDITVNIDQIVLHDISLSRAQRPVLRAAIVAELGKLIAAGGINIGTVDTVGATNVGSQAGQRNSPNGNGVPSIFAGNIQLSQHQNPRQMGQQIARAVYGGMTK